MFSRRIRRRIRTLARGIENGLVSPQTAYLACEPFFRLLGRRRNAGGTDLSGVRSVLVVRLDEIGDVVMTAPFLRELRRNLKKAWITLVVNPAVFNLVKSCPYVNEVLIYDGRADGRFGLLRRHGRALRLAYRHLLRRRFALAIAPRWDADHYNAAMVAYLGGAAQRVGYPDRPIAGKKGVSAGLDILYTQVIDGDGVKHEVERNLDVILALGGKIEKTGLELWHRGGDAVYADLKMRDGEVEPDDLVVALCPSGGNSALKKWPIERFIELGRWLQTEYDARIVLVGGPRDQSLGGAIQLALGRSVINTIGTTSLTQTGAVLKKCSLYVGCDTGPMHLAAASGTPVVALFGSSCHHRFGPWGSGHRIVSSTLPCSPCLGHDHIDRCGKCSHDWPLCMSGIAVEQVKAAVAECVAAIKPYSRVEIQSSHTAGSAAQRVSPPVG